MTFSHDDEITHIATGVLARTLPKPQWTHAAHIAAGVYMLNEQGERAFATMPDIIRIYNEATGVQNTDNDGYHETITQASLRVIYDEMKAGRAPTPLFEIANKVIAGPMGNPDWLLGYWSKALLFSVKARRSWVDADLKPFPYQQ